MTLRHMRIFIEVCRLESITKASEALNMAQPAVSCAIRELESYYGVNLFERMNRRIYLTEVGQYLLGYANTIVTQFEEAKETIPHAASKSRIHIGSNVTFGTAWLPDYLALFQQNHPEITVYTVIHNSSQIEALLLRNELDFAIVDNLSTSPYFHSKLIQSETMAAVCSPQSPYYPESGLLTLSTFAAVPLLTREKGSGLRECIEEVFQTNGMPCRPRMESISTQALIEACIRGLGILILSRQLIKTYLEQNLLTELTIKDATFSRNYYLIWHNSKYKTNSMQLFFDLLDK